MESLAVHDVVQVVPEHHWAGCFVYVTEMRDWGVVGYVEIPLTGRAYIRLGKDEYERVGRAPFVGVAEEEAVG